MSKICVSRIENQTVYAMGRSSLSVIVGDCLKDRGFYRIVSVFFPVLYGEDEDISNDSEIGARVREAAREWRPDEHPPPPPQSEHYPTTLARRLDGMLTGLFRDMRLDDNTLCLLAVAFKPVYEAGGELNNPNAIAEVH